MRALMSMGLLCAALNLWAQTDVIWLYEGDVAAEGYDNLHPRLAVNRQGDPVVIWSNAGEQALYLSRWEGSAFGMPMRLNPDGMSIAGASWMGPDIAAKGDTVHVVARKAPETEVTNRIHLFSSFDGGATFNAPVELGFIGDSISRFPTVTVDALGNPSVAFMKFNPSFLDSRWVVTRSTDLGMSFGPDVKVSGWGGSAEVCDCCPGALVQSGETMAMLYRDNNANIRDIWAGVSDNGGVTFGTGMQLDDNDWMVMSCPSSGPDGVVIGDTLYATFMSSGGGSYRAYLSTTALSTGQTENVVGLTENEVIAGLSQQNYPRVATDGTGLAVVWKQNVTGQAQLCMRVTADIENGLGAGYDTVALGHVTNCDVVMDQGRICVVWQNDNTGTVRYRIGELGVTGTGALDETETEVRVYPIPTMDLIHIDIGNVATATIHVYDMHGRLMQARMAAGRQTIDTRAWPKGPYHIRISTVEKAMNQRIVIQ